MERGSHRIGGLLRELNRHCQRCAAAVTVGGHYAVPSQRRGRTDGCPPLASLSNCACFEPRP